MHTFFRNAEIPPQRCTGCHAPIVALLHKLQHFHALRHTQHTASGAPALTSKHKKKSIQRFLTKRWMLFLLPTPKNRRHTENSHCGGAGALRRGRDQTACGPGHADTAWAIAPMWSGGGAAAAAHNVDLAFGGWLQHVTQHYGTVGLPVPGRAAPKYRPVSWSPSALMVWARYAGSSEGSARPTQTPKNKSY